MGSPYMDDKPVSMGSACLLEPGVRMNPRSMVNT